jgi:hypothetical protein
VYERIPSVGVVTSNDSTGERVEDTDFEGGRLVYGAVRGRGGAGAAKRGGVGGGGAGGRSCSVRRAGAVLGWQASGVSLA